MLGELISETKGKRLLRRVLSTDPLQAEVSFEDSGKTAGVQTNGFGTYTSTVSADGTLYGEGHGAMMSADGEMATWRGSGTGRFTGGGALSYRGILYFKSNTPKLGKLNGKAGVFEYEVDPNGMTTSKVWEWK